jgi:hypothetical protein
MKQVGRFTVRQITPESSGSPWAIVEADIAVVDVPATRCLFRARLTAGDVAALTAGEEELHYTRLPGEHRLTVGLWDLGRQVELDHLDHHPPLSVTAAFPPDARWVWGNDPVRIERPTSGEGVIVQLKHWFGRSEARPVVSDGPTTQDGTEQWHASARPGRYLLDPGSNQVRFTGGLGGGWVMGTRMTVLPLRTAAVFGDAATGRSPEVFAYNGPAITVSITAKWPVVAFYYPDGTGRRYLLMNGGIYKGKRVVIPPGPGLLAIRAADRWSIERVSTNLGLSP